MSPPPSTKTAPVLIESLADKKVKIGELVELSVAGGLIIIFILVKFISITVCLSFVQSEESFCISEVALDPVVTLSKHLKGCSRLSVLTYVRTEHNTC